MVFFLVYLLVGAVEFRLVDVLHQKLSAMMMMVMLMNVEINEILATTGLTVWL